jgi:hypothetical protein
LAEEKLRQMYQNIKDDAILKGSYVEGALHKRYVAGVIRSKQVILQRTNFIG